MNSVSLQARGTDEFLHGVATACIGPNAVIQTLRAIRQLQGPEIASALAADAGISEQQPNAMIPEANFVRLVAALRAHLSVDRSAPILARAGSLTATYVAANRIPRIFKLVLRLLPARLALPLLLAAFRRHAWTFAGRSQFWVVGAFPGQIVLDDAPTCRRASADSCSGEYYAAAFEGLLTLACANVRVREVACRSRGARDCRFAIETTTDPARG
ncbi:MAG: bacteriochlorophyll 4-vinyl reductase [Woeseiaceae bacterium]